jgi:hypothetical protein
MMGTFGGALEARHIDASNGKLTADVTGEVDVVYVSKSWIERKQGPLRIAYLPGESQPVTFIMAFSFQHARISAIPWIGYLC